MYGPIDPSCIKAFNCWRSYNISKFVTTIKRLRIRSIFVLNFYKSMRYLGDHGNVHRSFEALGGSLPSIWDSPSE